MKVLTRIGMMCGLVAATSLAVLTGAASAATFTVTNNNAAGAGSLAQALLDAAGNAGADTINFDPATNGLTIPGGININNDDVTVVGNGIGVTIVAGTLNINAGGGGTAAATVSGLTVDEININSGNAGATATASITDVAVALNTVNVNSGFGSVTNATFTNLDVLVGRVNVNSGFNDSSTTVALVRSFVQGGVVVNAGTSTTVVTIEDSTVEGGQADVLAVDNVGSTVTVRRSTLANSTSDGIDHNGGTLNVTNSTITGIDNTGVKVGTGTVTLTNVTVAGTMDSLDISDANVTVLNSIFVDSGADACAGGAPTSLGGNFADDATCNLTGTGDQQSVTVALGALADNGGPTQTRLPAAGSPVIDGGVAAGCPATDQRGVARPQDGNGDSSAVCDSGAVEIPAVTTATTAAPTTAAPTTAAPTTATPTTATPTTGTAVGLPPTGSDDSLSLVAIALLVVGSGLAVLARRRPAR